MDCKNLESLGWRRGWRFLYYICLPDLKALLFLGYESAFGSEGSMLPSICCSARKEESDELAHSANTTSLYLGTCLSTTASPWAFCPLMHQADRICPGSENSLLLFYTRFEYRERKRAFHLYFPCNVLQTVAVCMLLSYYCAQYRNTSEAYGFFPGNPRRVYIHGHDPAKCWAWRTPHSSRGGSAWEVLKHLTNIRLQQHPEESVTTPANMEHS